MRGKADCPVIPGRMLGKADHTPTSAGSLPLKHSRLESHREVKGRRGEHGEVFLCYQILQMFKATFTKGFYILQKLLYN